VALVKVAADGAGGVSNTRPLGLTGAILGRSLFTNRMPGRCAAAYPRAGKVHSEYLAHARKMDQAINRHICAPGGEGDVGGCDYGAVCFGERR